MKIKFLAIFVLTAFLFLTGCGGDKANTNTNTNTATVTTPTPVAKTSETAAVDNTLKTKTEDALKKKGFTDVTVDTSTTPSATLRGTVPKGKLAEAVQTAQEAAGKPFINQLTEK